MEKNIRILALDDDPNVRQLLELVLAGHGFDVTTAADGKSALTLL